MDYSADSDESENSFSFQNVRQWCKIDVQNFLSAFASFRFLGDIGSNFTMVNDATVLYYFELFFWRCYVASNSESDQLIGSVIYE